MEFTTTNALLSLSLPLVLFINNFKIYKNIYRAFKNFYITFINFNYKKQRYKSNNFTFTLKLYSIKLENIVYNFKLAIKKLKRSIIFNIKKI